MIELEMGHVRMPLSWKQFVFHRGCAFYLKSILGAGRIAGPEKVAKADKPCSSLHLGVPILKENFMMT